MGIIHVLDSEISNRIAAGEVVERPSSVIKELVENSIDAKASKIIVEINNGGITYMRVSDNGVGMSEEDAKLCFLRHATSKIKTGNDLDAIYTLGFRGEALSSIGAVAKVSLSTKRKIDETGITVTCEGGEILSSDDSGTPDGTSIEVKDLFYNTPARLKFLKKDSTEGGYITDIITKFILSHPEISFKLVINGNEKLYSAGDGSIENAVYTVYGKDYAKNMRSVNYENEGIKVTGLVGTGNVSRPNRNYQSFFVNSRYIKSPLIIKAVEEAYKNQIMIGKFPVAILNIEINAELIDINVHPTKLEVKFSNEKAIYHTVYYGVKNALYEEANVPKIEHSFDRDKSKEQLYISDMVSKLPPKEEISNNPYEDMKKGQKNTNVTVSDLTKRPQIPSYNPRKNPFMDNGYIPKTTMADVREPKRELEPILSYDDIREKDTKSESGVLNKATVTKTVKEAAKEKIITNTDNTEAESLPKNETENVFIDEYFRIVGQVFDTYIIAEKGDEMLIVDQHAAHERLKYEELKKDIEEKAVFSQMLLEPVIIKMTGAEYDAFDSIRDEFFNMGFECDDFGDNTVLVRSVPGDVELGEVEDLFLAILSEAQKKEIITDTQQRLLYTIACKAAIKANRKMGIEEMEVLLRNVLRLKNINTCPHGRPIIITMSKKEIEKEFGRIV